MDDDWDERYRTGSYVPRTSPSSLLERNINWLPDGRALDIATGTGRNAMFLSEAGYDVDAVDISRVALSRAQAAASDRNLHVNWIQADIEEGSLPDSEYAVIHCSFYHRCATLSDVKACLVDGGVLLWEHYLRTTDDLERGPSNRYRYGANELLRGNLDLTIIRYTEATHVYEGGTRDGERGALVQMVARKTTGRSQSYPSIKH